MSASSEVGWVAAELEQEFPGLGLRFVNCAVSAGRSPPGIRERLATLSSRFRGARAMTLRREDVPAAFRVFFHHIGLDPDVARTPIEQAAFDRLMAGRFRTGGLLQDALLIALLETSVAVWALDGQSVEGPLGIRPAIEGETLGGEPGGFELPAGRLVVADASAPVAVLFGDLSPVHAVHEATGNATLFAVQVAGVSALHLDEALWTAESVLGAG